MKQLKNKSNLQLLFLELKQYLLNVGQISSSKGTGKNSAIKQI